MNRMFLFWSLWTVAAGLGIPLIGVLNNGIARSVGNPITATAVMFAVGFVIAVVLALSLYGLPDFGQLGTAPWTSYFSGFIIVFYAASATVIIPRFGAGNFVAFILLAQLVMAAVMDQFGLFGLEAKPINLMRGLAFALIAIGIVVMQVASSRK